MCERRAHGHTRHIRQCTVVVEHVHINAHRPHTFTGPYTQRLHVDATRFLHATFKQTTELRATITRTAIFTQRTHARALTDRPVRIARRPWAT